MKSTEARTQCRTPAEDSVSEILVLPDGRIFAHNISPVMAEVLSHLNPADEPMRLRANEKKPSPNELSG